MSNQPKELDWKVRSFEVDDEKKGETLEWVRKSIIPSLVVANYPTERVLKILQYSSTWGLQDIQPIDEEEQYNTIISESGLFSERSDKDIKNISRKVLSSERSDIQVSLAHGSPRGRYRELGEVRVNKQNASSQRRKVWSKRFIQVFSRDGQAAYAAPEHDIDELMDELCKSYDELESTHGNSPVETALRLSFFYTIGNKIIHPFIDGNHRGFDRFLEYGFAKAGIPFKLPQDESFNIPIEEPFRNLSANFMSNFLVSNKLMLFIDNPPKKFYDSYQEKLIRATKDIINAKLDDPFFLYFYALIAGELLKWTPDSHSVELDAIKEKAKKDGNFQVALKV